MSNPTEPDDLPPVAQFPIAGTVEDVTFAHRGKMTPLPFPDDDDILLDLDDDEEDTAVDPTTPEKITEEEINEWASKHKPPQSWYESPEENLSE